MTKAGSETKKNELDASPTDEGATKSELIRLESIAFDQPPFRKLGSIDIQIAPRITLIAGRNGVGKSTILALIAGSSGLTRGSSSKSYFGNLPNANAEEILRLSFERDFVKSDVKKPYVLLTYRYGTAQFKKKGNVTGSAERLRVVPRNEPKGPLSIDGLNIPADGKVPIPTIYLGMMRVLPIGETDPGDTVSGPTSMAPEDYGLYVAFTNRVIDTGRNDPNGQLTSQSIKGTKKNSVYPEYAGYDSTNVSLGQDSLSSIATALASFSKLKRELGSNYRGGLLVIDELDAGFHPHAQIQLFEELKSAARSLDIQIVATTHSLTLLEHAHLDIHNDKKVGEPRDQIIYLKAGLPIELLDATEFSVIQADMHMQLYAPPPPTPTIKLYVEDDEAHLFLTAILTKARKGKIRTDTGYNLDLISVRLGCSNLVNLPRADPYFKSVVIVLDADTEAVRFRGLKNIVRLPKDPLHSGKQSPEVLILAMCKLLCSDATAYPNTRALLKSVGADTTFVQKDVVAAQKGETAAAAGIEHDREAAKRWFNLRKAAITQMRLIEGWVQDNAASVDTFMKALAVAVQVATGQDAPATPKKAGQPP